MHAGVCFIIENKDSINNDFFPKHFPNLETSRLLLRELHPEDEESIYRNFSDEEVVRFVMPPLQSRAEASDLLAGLIEGFYRQKHIFWSITLKEDDAFIGTCSYEGFTPYGCGEIGYDLVKSYWGKGYMREALVEMIRYGFKELGLIEIEALIDPRNERSIRLIEKLDFTCVGQQEGDLRYLLLNNGD